MSLRIFLILGVMLTLLCSCGGGKDDEDSPTTPQITSCMPSRQAYEAVPLGTSYAAAAAQLGCPGIKWYEEGTQAQQNLLQQYIWSAQLSTGGVQSVNFDFRSDKLIRKYRDIFDVDVCQITQTGFDSVSMGATLDQVFATLGCKGHLARSELLNGEVHSSYRWHPQTQIYIYFTDNYVSGKTAMVALSGTPSSCIPALENTKRLSSGMTPEQAATLLQCSGLKTSESIYSTGLGQSTYVWGRYGGPTVYLVFYANKLIQWDVTGY